MQQALKVAADILARQHTPSIPLELLELKAELNKKYPNTVTVAQLISHNPELLANFLNLANTNLTQEKNPIQDAKVAVNLLGLQEIYNLFLSSVLSHILAEDDYERSILLHGAKAGLAAAELSYWVFDVSRTEAYIAGLMQNVGAIYLYRQHPDSYPDMFAGELSNPVSGYQKNWSVTKQATYTLAACLARNGKSTRLSTKHSSFIMTWTSVSRPLATAKSNTLRL